MFNRLFLWLTLCLCLCLRLQTTCLIKPQEGRHVPQADGIICLNFDNYFSWVTNKTVSYRFEYEAEGGGGEAKAD